MIRDNDLKMKARIFPLREGVPYKTREGYRVVLKSTNHYLLGSNALAYEENHGYVFAEGVAGHDIVDYHIEEGIWQLCSGKVVELRRPADVDMQYPFWGYEVGTEQFRYSFTSDGYYHNSFTPSELDIASYVRAEEQVSEPEGFLHSGYWLRRDNKIVRLEWDKANQRFIDTSGADYPPHLDGRVNADWISTLDLIRPVTSEEYTKRVEDIFFRTKSYMDYVREGLYRQYGIIQLVVMPTIWQDFITKWAELRDGAGIDKDSMFCSSVARDIELYPDEITYKVEQMYLHDRYRIQHNIWNSVKGQFIEEKDGSVRMIEPIRYPSRIREHESLRGFNSPTTTKGAGCTFNPITNWHAEIERDVATKERRGEYKEMPSDFPYKWGTGVHISTQNANLLAYYPTFRHWQRRVPQQIKAGRYLRQFFPHLSDDQIRRYSAEIGTGELKFYSDWYDMFKVYRDLDANGVVSSCMSKDRWGSVHPLMVYDNSDVELAVLYMGDKPVARALYNKHNKHYPMVYGQWEKMYVALTDAGFIHDSLCGAKIRRLPRRVSSECPTENGFCKVDAMPDYDSDSDCVLMPYIDHKRDLDRSSNCSTSVDVHSDHIVIRYDGNYEADNYDYAYVDLNQDNNKCTCDHCGERVDEEDMYYVEGDEISVCEHCCEHHVVRVFTSRNDWFDCMQGTADSRYVWVDAANRYYRDIDAAVDAGYCWSDEDDCWYHEDDCVFVEELSDYRSTDDVGKYIMWDGVESEYVTAETYYERVAEREQQEAA